MTATQPRYSFAFRAMVVGTVAALTLSPALASRRPLFDLRPQAGPVTALALSPDDTRVAAACADQKIRIWDVASRETVAEINARPIDQRGASSNVRETEKIESIAFSPDGARLADAYVRGLGRGLVRSWQISDSKLAETYVQDATGIRAVAYQPGSGALAVCVRDPGATAGAVRLFKPGSKEPAAVLRAPDLAVSGLHFTADGAVLLTYAGGKALIWNTEKGAVTHTLSPDHKGGITAGAISRDGKWVATGGSDGRVLLFDGESGKKLREIKANLGAITALSFSPSGRSLLGGGANRGMRIWSTANGLQREPLFYHRDRITGALFSSDGQRIFSSSTDGSVAVWSFDEPDTEPAPGEDEDQANDE